MKKLISSILLINTFLFVNSAFSTEFVVDNLFDGVDSNPGDGKCETSTKKCTLRAAIMEANILPGKDVIHLSSGTYNVMMDVASQKKGELQILDDLEILGTDRGKTVIVANTNKPEFIYIDGVYPQKDQKKLKLKDLSIILGKDNKRIRTLLENMGDLTVEKVNLNTKPSGRVKYSIYGQGRLALLESEINNSDVAVQSHNTGIIYINNSTIANNREGLMGGSKVEIYRSTFIKNEGGAVSVGPYRSVHNKLARTSMLLIKDSKFINNGGGGAMTGGTISGSLFESNGSRKSGCTLAITNVNLVDSEFINNTSKTGAGAICARAGSKIERVKVVGNVSKKGVGGIKLSGNVFIKDAIIRGNTGRYGGGISLYGKGGVVLDSLEISENKSDFGGGVFVDLEGERKVKLFNSTIANNEASKEGGGLHFAQRSSRAKPNFTMMNNTVVNNTSKGGGQNISMNKNSEAAGVSIINTIISNNNKKPSCKGRINSLGFNISSDSSCNLGVEGDKANTNPEVNVLADNGGFGRTIGLQGNSPAIDSGMTNVCLNDVKVDQRGELRNEACDIGAFELN